MVSSMHIDPDELRRLATQYQHVAGDTRERAQSPTEWLAGFRAAYGSVCDPIRETLMEYYSLREDIAEELASSYEQIAVSLHAAAKQFEEADLDGRRQIERSFSENNDQVDQPGSTGPSATPPNNTAPPSVTPPDSPGDQPPQTLGAGPGEQTGSPEQDGGEQDGQGNENTDSASPSDGPPGTGDQPRTTDNAGAGAPSAQAGPGGMVPPGGAPPGGAVSSTSPRAPHTPSADGVLAPGVAQPFNAAAANKRDTSRSAEQSDGETTDSDLAYARALLSAVLAALEPTVGMTWAVSVMRGPSGAGAFITSNEGRGWLPAGLFLPSEVSTPWQWDDVLSGTGAGGSPWEGVSDPARVLVEFGHVWGESAGAELSALVSSGPIDSSLRRRLPGVSTEGLVAPNYDIDLRVLAPGTVDRLGTAGSIPALERVSTIPDDEVEQRCLGMAVHAHSELARSSAAPVAADEVRAVRERILAALQAGESVPRQWWDELRSVDDQLSGSMMSHRVDAARVEIGALRVGAEAATLRSLVWERRCNELVLLLGQEQDRQTLRDVVYVHEQIVEHPDFGNVRPTVSAPDERPADRGTTTSGVVSAPQTSPPAPAPAASGVVSPPVTEPPPTTVAPPVSPPPDIPGRS